MTLPAAILAALLFVTSGPVSAQSQIQTLTQTRPAPVVVELFTSQGCSSCPPADALMIQLAKRDDVIPLSLHVDYWDYIGWPDEFGDPFHTLRQKAYARVGGRRMIYTPQMVVNGQEDIVGARAMELADLIMKYRSTAKLVTVQARRSGNSVMITVQPLQGPVPGPLMVQLVRYTRSKTTKITRGENAGRNLDYANIVDGWRVVGKWDGAGILNIETEMDGDRPAVVLVQQEGPGAILAAARAE
jgi:hypothetical protein